MLGKSPVWLVYFDYFFVDAEAKVSQTHEILRQHECNGQLAFGAFFCFRCNAFRRWNCASIQYVFQVRRLTFGKQMEYAQRDQDGCHFWQCAHFWHSRSFTYTWLIRTSLFFIKNLKLLEKIDENLINNVILKFFCCTL